MSIGIQGLAGRVVWPIRAAVDEVFPIIWREKLAEAIAEGWAIDDRGAYCGRCGASMDASGVTQRGCAECLNTRPAWAGVTRLGAYRPPLSDWIVDMKFHGQWHWARWFGEELARRVDPPARADRTVVCPVPMHWRRRWKRGYNQSLLMTQAVGRAWRLPVAEALVKTRATRPQVAVELSARKANVRGAFESAGVDLSGWDVWLVDDVKTTGATLTVCARELKRAGAQEVRVVTVAVAER